MMHYLAWMDDSKKPLDAKLSEGAQAYTARFGVAPTVVVVHSTEQTQRSDMTVRVEAWAKKSYYHFGQE